ncbi:MAG: hypothetical protein GY913_07730 [Proteobacteria bacterium]|nr:hypothetical protein [Pseudomonadota bacterium]MCP4916801.1 hypothetical protein [Pseudomonadota bacterium]
MLGLLLACAPCDSVVGYYEGPVSGDAEGTVSLDVSMADAERLQVNGWWLPDGLARNEQNVSTTRGCFTEGPTVLEVDQAWVASGTGVFTEWIGDLTLFIGEEGAHGGWEVEVWSGRDEASATLESTLAGSWRAEKKD